MDVTISIQCFDIGLKGNLIEHGTIMGVSWNSYAYYLRCDPILFTKKADQRVRL
jgi:hypothetical protein